MRYIEGQDRNQMILFPETMDEYISKENPVRVIDVYVEQLDMIELGFEKAVCAATGRPSYNPKDLLRLYLYGYLNRVRSSRRLEDETIRTLKVIWLMRKLQPDHKTIANFRKNNDKAIRAVLETSQVCVTNGAYMGRNWLPLTVPSFGHVIPKETTTVLKSLKGILNISMKRLINTYRNLMKMMKMMNWKQLTGNLPRMKSRKESKNFVNANKNMKGIRNSLKKPVQLMYLSTEISTTDPDARLMCNNNNTIDVSYNVQTTVDSKHKLIADFKVTQNPNDLGELDNMSLRAKELFGVENLEVLADKGYYKAEDLKKCVDNGITPYVTK